MDHILEYRKKAPPCPSRSAKMDSASTDVLCSWATLGFSLLRRQTCAVGVARQ